MELIKKLRDRQPVKLFNSADKVFTQIQLNRKASVICWERWVSKDRKNWVNVNLYLSLKDVASILNKHQKTTHE